MRKKILSEIITPLFAVISYLIADLWQISRLFLVIEDSKSHIAISILIYTAILNMIYFFILSKRTNIIIEIVDKKDKSNKIKIIDSPRNIEVFAILEGNIKNIKHNISLEFPEWLDVSTQKSPDLKLVSEDTFTVYEIILENVTEKTKRVFKFDIIIKPSYSQSGRGGIIKSEFKGNCLRYKKELKNLEVNYTEDGL